MSMRATSKVRPTLSQLDGPITRSSPKSPTVLEWIGVGNVVIEKNARVLHFPEKREPVLGLNSDFQAQAVQHIKVACIREAGTQRALQAITVLAAKVKPARQDLVEFGNGK